MSEESRKDIRMLLKKFGVQADEAIVQHLTRLDRPVTLKLRCTLEDVTDYEDAPAAPLAFTVEADVRSS